MAGSDEEQGQQKPSEQRGGTTPDEAEALRKGTAAAGIVPPELGGSDAPREMLGDDPELGSEVLGKTTGSNESATDDGIDVSAGAEADATSDGGPDAPPAGEEPPQQDAPAVSRLPGD
ncbi:MAG: hypothetical protein ACR2KV_15035 [Solirubrobacteraceae bacterium]